MSVVYLPITRATMRAIARRHARRADRLMAELGACDATVRAYEVAAFGAASVGDHDAAHVYQLRAARCAELASDGPPATPARARGRRDTAVIEPSACPACPDRSGCPVQARPGYVAPRR